MASKLMLAVAIFTTGIISCGDIEVDTASAFPSEMMISATVSKIHFEATFPEQPAHEISLTRELWQTIDGDGDVYRVIVIKSAPKMPHTRNLYRYFRCPTRDIISCHLKGAKGVVLSKDDLADRVFVDKTWQFDKFLLVLEYESPEINDSKAVKFFNSLKIVKK